MRRKRLAATPPPPSPSSPPSKPAPRSASPATSAKETRSRFASRTASFEAESKQFEISDLRLQISKSRRNQALGINYFQICNLESSIQNLQARVFIKRNAGEFAVVFGEVNEGDDDIVPRYTVGGNARGDRVAVAEDARDDGRPRPGTDAHELGDADAPAGL